MGMAIRPTRDADLPACAEVFAQAFAGPPYGDRWDRGRAERKLRKLHGIDPGYCLCAEVSGVLVGAVFCRVDYWWLGDCVVIEELFVHPSYHGRGVGSALVDAVEAAARRQGVVGIWLIANKEARAYDFYQRRGFHEQPSVAVMLKDLEA